ncbi:hypothetical protein THICB1_70009 [Thiomonas arsenitoxydans]|uniref:Uncharacterized protein n=1 Tax=Thiomonas arsenitoxydans (strain DSM 22701 / CIP 110005 / 3As) TaxID=426114 RepID=A0ABM9T9D4_THIA3|nr:hypothetical protein THICB1_70009 [Thiomonas arsenitoxydans]CQR37962.1 hypothetical protein THICB6_60011 [Thiomonas arsenitoxydans]CQR40620.1 hypothetical protein ACO3_620020 [Thiomonas arsenitoxydans]CQR40666.1 hypothetical protein ACO7_640020 [Thiomonas arsenitoxydans]
MATGLSMMVSSFVGVVVDVDYRLATQPVRAAAEQGDAFSALIADSDVVNAGTASGRLFMALGIEYVAFIGWRQEVNT